jgi:hypothetical protein
MLQDHTVYDDEHDTVVEWYECQDCGQMGKLKMRKKERNELAGCLERVGL